jgi:hypothetical protein
MYVMGDITNNISVSHAVLDGVTLIPNADNEIQCNQMLFNATGLSNKEHKLVITFIGPAVDEMTNALVLSNIM